MVSGFSRVRLPKRSRRSATAALLLAGTLVAGPVVIDAAAASVLVVRSSGPQAKNYRPGKTLPDNAKVALGLGDVLVVLGGESARTLRGPGTFALTGVANLARPAVNAVRRGRFSSLRNAGIVPRSPTLWHVDVAQNGKICLADAQDVTLWRSNPSQSVTLTVAGAGGTTRTASWPAGQETLPWPKDMPIVAGGEYRMSWDGKTDPTRVTFATLPVVPTDVRSVAQALIEQHCDAQLDLLIQTVPTEIAGPT